MDNVYTGEELEEMNRKLLSRGKPNVNDDLGYNRADFNTCSRYYHGLPYTQLAELSKRLIKYTETQLNVDKDKMIRTSEYYEEIADKSYKYNDISVYIDKESENTIISFDYNKGDNQRLTVLLKYQFNCNYDESIERWIVPNNKILNVLMTFKEYGADVDNAISVVKSNGIV